jgi:hypothetical protein
LPNDIWAAIVNAAREVGVGDVSIYRGDGLGEFVIARSPRQIAKQFCVGDEATLSIILERFWIASLRSQ